MSENSAWVLGQAREEWERTQAGNVDKPLYLKVLAILTQHDPIGIGWRAKNPYWQTEYAPEANTIVPHVLPSHNVDDVRHIVHKAFGRLFALPPDDPPKDTMTLPVK